MHHQVFLILSKYPFNSPHFFLVAPTLYIRLFRRILHNSWPWQCTFKSQRQLLDLFLFFFLFLSRLYFALRSFCFTFEEELLQSNRSRFKRFNLLTLHFRLFVSFLLLSWDWHISFFASNCVVTFVASFKNHSHGFIYIKVAVICGFNLVIVRNVLIKTIPDFAVLDAVIWSFEGRIEILHFFL